jgi:hypothetical protein
MTPLSLGFRRGKRQVHDRQAKAELQKLAVIDVLDHTNQLSDSQFCVEVLGSTGNLYTTRINGTPDCSCPDFRKNYPMWCKHLYFVLSGVGGVVRPRVGAAVETGRSLAAKFLLDAATVDKARLRLIELAKTFDCTSSLVVTDESTTRPVVAFIASAACRKVYLRIFRNSDCAICRTSDPSIRANGWYHDLCGAKFHKECLLLESKQNGKSRILYCPECHGHGDALLKPGCMDISRCNLLRLVEEDPSKDEETRLPFLSTSSLQPGTTVKENNGNDGEKKETVNLAEIAQTVERNWAILLKKTKND